MSSEVIGPHTVPESQWPAEILCFNETNDDVRAFNDQAEAEIAL